MIDRYTWYETVGIYLGIAALLFFAARALHRGLPGVAEAALAAVFLALPLLAGERLPHLLLHAVGPRAADGALHLQQPVHRLRQHPDSALAVGARRICVRALQLSRRRAAARRLPCREDVLRRRPDHPALPPDAIARGPQHLFRDDRAPRRLPDPDRHLAAQDLHDAHSARARRGGLGRRRQPSLHAAPRHPAASPCPASW